MTINVSMIMTGVNIELTIITLNQYLKSGLQAVIQECEGISSNMNSYGENSGEIYDIEPVKLAIIDIDCISTQRSQWKKASNAILSSNSFAFMSFSGFEMPGFPFLALNSSMNDLKSKLINIIKNKDVIKNLPQNRIFLSSLNCQERKVFLFLAYGLQPDEVSNSLNLSNKGFYRLRSQIMDKLNLDRRFDFYTLLKITVFIEYFERLRWRYGRYL